MFTFTLALPSAGQVGAGPSPVAPSENVEVDITQWSVQTLATAMDRGDLTSEQIVDAALHRIAAVDQQGPSISALLTLNPEARAQARALDVERRQSGARGPLHGIPVVVKDNIDTVDQPTRAASAALNGSVPGQDALVVARLRAAGAIILGKTNMQEFALGFETVSSLGGRTLNPYDPGRNVGGSSGGTAAAVTAGMAPVGLGTDTCGSLRVPSAYTQLTTLRPTRGLLDTAGVIGLAPSQDAVGAMGRTAADVAVMTDVMAAPAGSGPGTVDGTSSMVSQLDDDALAGARIGVIPDQVVREAGDETVATVFETALDRMSQAGATIVRLDDQPQITNLLGSGLINEEFRFALDSYLADLGPDRPRTDFDEVLGSGLVSAEVVNSMAAAATAETLDSPARATALAFFAALEEELVRLLDQQGLSALAYPSMRRGPAAVGAFQPGINCRLSAFSGLPAVSLPMGLADGLPVGMDLLGGPGEDGTLLALAHSHEQQFPQRAMPSLTALDSPDPTPTVVNRLSGNNRIETAVAVSHDRWVDATLAIETTADLPGSRRAESAVITAARAFPDALVSVPLADHVRGPLLLTAQAETGPGLSPQVVDEVRRVLSPGATVHLVGGTAVLDPRADQFLTEAGYEVRRHAGPNRFATAVAVAEVILTDSRMGGTGALFVADGVNYPDALIAGPAAAAQRTAVLLTAGGELPDETSAWLDTSTRSTIAIGGAAADALADAHTAVDAPGEVDRIVGGDRIETAVLVADRFFPDTPVAGLATSDAFPDALSGGAHVATAGAPMLLTGTADTPAVLSSWLARQDLTLETLTLFGGPMALPPPDLDALDGVFWNR